MPTEDILLRIGRRLADIRRKCCYIDEGSNTRVIPGLGDDCPSVTMADKHYQTWLLIDSTCHGIYIVRKCAQGVLHGDDAQAFELQ